MQNFVEGEQNKVAEHLKRADVLSDQGKFQEAIDECTKAINIDPNCSKAYEKRAIAYTLQYTYECSRGGNPSHLTEKALVDFETAKRLETQQDNSAKEQKPNLEIKN